MPKGKKENADKIRYMSRYLEAKAGEAVLRRMLEDLEGQISPKAITYSDMPKGGGDGKDLTDYVIKREETMEKLKRQIREKEQIQLEIIDVIANLSKAPKETARQMQQDKTLLYMRYIQGLRWEDIMDKIGYEWSHVHRIHGRALNNITIKG